MTVRLQKFLLGMVLVLAAVLPASTQTAQSNAGLIARADVVLLEAKELHFSPVRSGRLAAASKYEEAIKCFLAAGEKSRAAETYNSLGTVWMSLNEYPKQLAAYESALEIYTSLNDDEGTALSLMNIGSSLTTAGENEQALKYLERAIPKFHAADNSYYESIATWSIAEIYDTLGVREKALQYYLAADKIDSTGQTLNAVAIAYDLTDKPSEAYRYFRRALALQSKTKDRFGMSKTHSYLGTHFAELRKYKLALYHFNKSIELNRTLTRSQLRDHAAALTTIEKGRLHYKLRNFAAALAHFEEARKSFAIIGDAVAEASALALIGDFHEERGDHDKARNAYLEELAARRRSADRPGEAFVLDSLRLVAQRSGNARLAIFFGKQAVNNFQDLRGAIKGLSVDVRLAYLRKFETGYKELADLLISEGRLPEAQLVLGMLKEEEVFDYVSRDASETEKLSKRADLTDDERKALLRYRELAEHVGDLGSEFSKLQQTKGQLAAGQSLPGADQKRYDELSTQLEQANTAFQVFLRELSDEFANRPKAVEDIRENGGLQSDLRSWGDGVVALYTIVGDDRYRVILTTPEVQTDGKFEIKAAELNRKIGEFRMAITNPRVDPRPLGKELYDILIKPIESQLDAAKAKTLLWSLDGTLRYVPLAALWDGRQYFGQKYQNVIITLASRTRLGDEPAGDWRVLGLGVTAAKQLSEPNGTRMLNFSALPSVREELGSIVRDEADPVDAGVISGTQLFDGQFTERSFEENLSRGFKVLHIASHFSFRPGDMSKSFLLLGDGTALTMNKVKTSPRLNFAGIELLTLSACDTAVGEADATGKEIESFAVIAQQKGAKAVMATLWPVADESTSMFMTEFYRTKAREATLSKAAALQQAQRAMIEGRIKPSGNAIACRAEQFAADKKLGFTCDPSAPYSHPYFWSPFVLIGNWR
jgi:CHAT domain-containing protein